MTDNIKAFLEADALRTQGDVRVELANEGEADVYIDNFLVAALRDWPDQMNARNDAAFIAAASRIPPDIRAMQDAFEQVRDALNKAATGLAAADAMLPYGGQLLSMAHHSIDDAIKAVDEAIDRAASYRKTGV